MLETPLQITTCLATAGESIIFAERTLPIVPPATIPEVLPSYTIKAIPGDTVYNIQNYDGVYDIEKQDFVFRTSEQLILTNGTKVGDLFSYARSNTSSNTFNFKITSLQPDSTGWVAIKATLLSTTS